jgi:hypothetical protein
VRRADGSILKIPTLGGETRTRTLPVPAGANPGLHVRAVNRVGAGPWRQSPGFTVATELPSAAVTAPGAGATVSGDVEVGWSAQANPDTQAGLSRVDLEVDGEIVNGRSVSGSSASGALTWFTTYETNGLRTVRVRVEDAHGKVAWSAPRTFTLANPVVSITSHQAGQTVSGKVSVSFTVANATGWSFSSGEVVFNGDSVPATQSSGTWTAVVDTRTAPNGTYDVSARLEDPAKGEVSRTIELRTSNTMPVITVTSPSGTVTDPRQRVTYTVDRAWPWDGFRAEVDGQWVGSAEPGEPLDVDLTRFASGSHTLRVVGEYGGWYTLSSPAKALTLSWPARSIAWNGGPATGSTVSDTVPAPYTLTPTAWSWQYACLEVDHPDWDWTDFDCVEPGEPLSFSSTWIENGTYPVRLHAYDSDDQHVRSATRTWTVAN